MKLIAVCLAAIRGRVSRSSCWTAVKSRALGQGFLAEGLGRNQGPTRIDVCHVDDSVLADGLRGNSRLKVFRAFIANSPEYSKRGFLAIANAVRENKGLVELDLRYGNCVDNETWGAICDCLETHPTLEVLNLCSGFVHHGEDFATTLAVLKSRIQTILDKVKRTCGYTQYICLAVIANMSFSEGRSFLISRRTGSGHAFLLSKKLAQLHTVPRCWEEHFCQLVLMRISFGCFYQGMPKLLFRRVPRQSRRLRTSPRLLLLPLLLLQMLLLSPVM
jgi:hypothetical protein